MRVILKEGGNLLPVFLFFEGAGGVNDSSTRLKAWQDVLQDTALDLQESLYLVHPKAPASINPASQDSCVRARDVEENTIEAVPPGRGSRGSPVMGGNRCDAHALSLQVLRETGNSFLIPVGAEERSLVAHQGRDERGLAPRSSTGIENGFPGPGIKEFDGMSGGRILNTNKASFDPSRRKRSFMFEVSRYGGIREGGAGLRIQEVRREDISTEIDPGRFVVPCQESFRCLSSELPGPSLAQPFRMGEAQSRRDFLELRKQHLTG